MINLDGVGNPLLLTDEFGDTLMLNPKDVCKAGQPDAFGTLECPDDKTFWITEQGARDLVVALQHLIANMEAARA